MFKLKSLTRKQLIEATGAKFYQITYLVSRDRLPLVRPSAGRGYPTLFHPAAIDIVIAHIDRNDVPVSPWRAA